MSDQEANVIRAGYRKVGVLLVIGLAGIGFTRFEDRAIIGVPGSPANAMAALATADDDSPPESYSGPPDDSVSLGTSSRVPANRIRRVLRDRDVPVVATRQILAPNAPQNPGAAEQQVDPVTNPAAVQAFSAVEPTVPTLASLTPPLPGQGSPVFAAPLPAPGGGGGGAGGGGGGGGQPGGGDGGGGQGGGGVVTPVPEPGTWLMLILGLFAIGGAMRQRVASHAERFRFAAS